MLQQDVSKVKSSGGKNIRSARLKIDKNKYYEVEEACDLLRKVSFAKFNETVDIAIRLGVDPRRSNQMVRGVVSMPFGTGKVVKVAVICQDDKVKEFKDVGADIVGSFDIIEQIKSGKIDYDVYIATPNMMVVVGQVARILGPKGLMPNPKLGTVTNDVAATVKNIKSGQVEFKVDKTGNVHAGIGKVSFSSNGIVENIKAFVSVIIQNKPFDTKNNYLKGIYLSTTMGPVIKVNTSTFISTSVRR